MTTDEFTAKWDGKLLDYDNAYGGQCVDVYRQYCQEVLNIPQSKPVVGAYQIWDTYLSDYFERIANSPSAIPQKGDIVIWNKYTGGGFGHVAIFIEGNVSQFTSFDENWPTGSVCHFQLHSYTNVIGWLRRKGVIITPEPMPTESFEKREQVIIDGYQALTGQGPSDDEKKYRLDTWQNTTEFLKSLTGDQRFYDLYIKPHVPDSTTSPTSPESTEPPTDITPTPNGSPDAFSALIQAIKSWFRQFFS